MAYLSINQQRIAPRKGAMSAENIAILKTPDTLVPSVPHTKACAFIYVLRNTVPFSIIKIVIRTKNVLALP